MSCGWARARARLRSEYSCAISGCQHEVEKAQVARHLGVPRLEDMNVVGPDSDIGGHDDHFSRHVPRRLVVLSQDPGRRSTVSSQPRPAKAQAAPWLSQVWLSSC